MFFYFLFLFFGNLFSVEDPFSIICLLDSETKEISVLAARNDHFRFEQEGSFLRAKCLDIFQVEGYDSSKKTVVAYCKVELDYSGFYTIMKYCVVKNNALKLSKNFVVSSSFFSYAENVNLLLTFATLFYIILISIIDQNSNYYESFGSMCLILFISCEINDTQHKARSQIELNKFFKRISNNIKLNPRFVRDLANSQGDNVHYLRDQLDSFKTELPHWVEIGDNGCVDAKTSLAGLLKIFQKRFENQQVQGDFRENIIELRELGVRN